MSSDRDDYYEPMTKCACYACGTYSTCDYCYDQQTARIADLEKQLYAALEANIALAKQQVCQHCNSGTFIITYTPSDTCESVAPDCKKISNSARNDNDDLPD